jgi:hypothetical protein
VRSTRETVTTDPVGPDAFRNRRRFTFDSNDRLHVTWQNNDDGTIGDLSAGGPIGIEDSGIGVVETPYNFWLINWGNQAIDSCGDLHFDGPLATGEDGYEHDRVRWERDGVLTIPMTVANGAGEYGTGYALREE